MLREGSEAMLYPARGVFQKVLSELELRLSKMNAVKKRKDRDQTAQSEGKQCRRECFTLATAPCSAEENIGSSNVSSDQGCIRKGCMHFLDKFCFVVAGCWCGFFFFHFLFKYS